MIMPFIFYERERTAIATTNALSPVKTGSIGTILTKLLWNLQLIVNLPRNSSNIIAFNFECIIFVRKNAMLLIVVERL